MAIETSKLKLGKGSGFVKRDLRQLPQTEDAWEADFLPLPLRPNGRSREWLGIVVSRNSRLPLATSYCEMMPTVNDLASLLSNAMRRPAIEVEDTQRPKKIFLRDNPHWAELMPHLEQLGIEVSTTERLPLCENEAADLLEKESRRPRVEPSLPELGNSIHYPLRQRCSSSVLPTG